MFFIKLNANKNISNQIMAQFSNHILNDYNTENDAFFHDDFKNYLTSTTVSFNQ
ncbi:hypothetical protein XCR1_960012 [Xenorhabdus cabanillasii JM26]|uniref:Uncharacterized protein n=1 Tax=Xenorhabdus cabanillasii JM26 TaxID=1427517 RepID=W1JA84_9GAMM|nr:hypothetical protein XCR1_960012 [Xenorhabdus cabanillasii JM26]